MQEKPTQNRPRNREEAIELTEEVARETADRTSNGNRFQPRPEDTKTSDAQHGGTGVESAASRQPPDAEITHPVNEQTLPEGP